MASVQYDDIIKALEVYLLAPSAASDLGGAGNDFRSLVSDDKLTNKNALALDLLGLFNSFLSLPFPKTGTTAGAAISPRRADSLAVRRMNHQSHYF